MNSFIFYDSFLNTKKVLYNYLFHKSMFDYHISLEEDSMKSNLQLDLISLSKLYHTEGVSYVIHINVRVVTYDIAYF